MGHRNIALACPEQGWGRDTCTHVLAYGSIRAGTHIHVCTQTQDLKIHSLFHALYSFISVFIHHRLTGPFNRCQHRGHNRGRLNLPRWRRKRLAYTGWTRWEMASLRKWHRRPGIAGKWVPGRGHRWYKGPEVRTSLHHGGRGTKTSLNLLNAVPGKGQ